MGKNAPIIADLMLAERGVHETPGPAATARIIEYGKHTTLKPTSDEVPWCSDAMNFIIDEARKTHPGIDLRTNSAAAISWAAWGDPVPHGHHAKGDVAVFTWRNSDGDVIGHHVAVVLQQADKNHPNMVQVVGGNQTSSGGPDSVNIKCMPLGRAVFRRPKNFNG